MSHNPESGAEQNLPAGYIEIPSGKIVVIPTKDLDEGKEVSILTKEGAALICRVKKNPEGNTNSSSKTKGATLTVLFPIGDELLLPYPTSSVQSYFIGMDRYQDSFAESQEFVGGKHIRFDLVADGSLQIADMSSPNGTLYRLNDPPEEEENYIRYLNKEKLYLSDSFQPLGLEEPHHVTIFYDGVSKLGGALYKLAHNEGYVFRDAVTRKTHTLTFKGTSELTVQTPEGRTIQFKIENNEIFAKGSPEVLVQTYGFNESKQIPAGQDGQIHEFINGGRAFFALTNREVGHSKYSKANEDNVGYNAKTARIVVADGLGGHGNGQHASALAVKNIIDNPGPFRKAISDAVGAAKFLTRELPKKADTVFVAAEFHGGRVNLASTGDARWFLIRNQGIIKENIRRTFVQDLININALTDREAYTDPRNKNFLTTVTTTLLSGDGSDPDKDPEYNYDVALQEGDLLLMVSDGVDILSEEEIVECVCGYAPDQGALRLREKIREKNDAGKYEYEPPDGLGLIELHSPWDNVTICIYKH